MKSPVGTMGWLRSWAVGKFIAPLSMRPIRGVVKGLAISANRFVYFHAMKKNPNAVALGKLGGDARTKSLTKQQRIEAARHAANSRHKRKLKIVVDVMPSA